MIRVLVVDDSSFMQKSLGHILKLDESIEVVDYACNGIEAVQKVKQQKPDVVIMDINMPRMDGLTALEHIMAESPLPVLILSGLTQKDSFIAVKAFSMGAVDVIAKPSGQISYDIDILKNEIISKVKIASSVDKGKLKLPAVKKVVSPIQGKYAALEKIVVIGASTGGPRAVEIILSSLPRDIPAAIIVIVHMRQEFVIPFVERLKWVSSINVNLAKRGEKIEVSKVYVVPAGVYTAVKYKDGFGTISFKKIPQDAPYVSIDYIISSVAKEYGKNAVGVLLTGMGQDGAQGMKAVKEAGGITIVEDASTCVVYGMPKAAIDIGAVDKVLPLGKIAEGIVEVLESR